MRPSLAFALVLAAASVARASAPPVIDDLSPADLARAEDSLAAHETPVAADIDATRVVCPFGARNVAGRCVDDRSLDLAAMAGGFLTTGGPGAPLALLLGVLALAALLFGRRRLALVLVLMVGCGGDGAFGWDDDAPVDRALIGVESAPRLAGDASRFLLAFQAYDTTAFDEPSEQFSLAHDPFPGAVAIRRHEDGAGDRLVASFATADGELLGYASAEELPGTAPLYRLADAAGHVVYESEPERLADLESDGYSRGATLGYVWPPNAAEDDQVGSDDEALTSNGGTTACTFHAHHALYLLYASMGEAFDESLLAGCPGEVVVGEKKHAPPHGLTTPALRAAGLRTAYVMSNFGHEIRDMLKESNGVGVTYQFVMDKLQAGYDYVVIDEITTDPDWADGSLVNRRFRQLLTRLPAGKIIPYISLDLTMEAGGAAKMRSRRQLLRTIKLRARAMALEVYVHTADAVAHRAGGIFRTANERVLAAVHGMSGVAGISRKMMTTLGLTIECPYPQYAYLDWPSHDLKSIDLQAKAIREGGHSLASERGVGFYFSSMSTVTPVRGAPYTQAELVQRVHKAMLRFR